MANETESIRRIQQHNINLGDNLDYKVNPISGKNVESLVTTLNKTQNAFSDPKDAMVQGLFKNYSKNPTFSTDTFDVVRMAMKERKSEVSKALEDYKLIGDDDDQEQYYLACLIYIRDVFRKRYKNGFLVYSIPIDGVLHYAFILTDKKYSKILSLYLVGGRLEKGSARTKVDLRLLPMYMYGTPYKEVEYTDYLDLSFTING